PLQDAPARRHLPVGRRPLAVRHHLHGRHAARVRRLRPGASEAGRHRGGRQAGQHGVGDVGWRARLRHLVAARQLGQEGRRRRAVPEGVRMGRQGLHAALRRRLPGGEARTPAHPALRPGPLLQEPDLLGRRAAGRRAVTRAPAALLLAVLLAAGARAEERAVKPDDLAYVYGVGRFSPEYAPPAPGTYTLPPIDDVADHPLIDSDGPPTTLYALAGDRPRLPPCRRGPGAPRGPPRGGPPGRARGGRPGPWARAPASCRAAPTPGGTPGPAGGGCARSPSPPRTGRSRPPRTRPASPR